MRNKEKAQMRIRQGKIKIKLKVRRLPFVVIGGKEDYESLVKNIMLNEIIEFGPLLFRKEDLQYAIYD